MIIWLCATVTAPCLQDPAAVTVIVCIAAPGAEGLVQNRHPGLSRLSQTKVERMSAFKKARRWHVHL